MDINQISDIFESKIRLAIISCLITGEKTFREIKDLTKATDGNLSIHIGKLENAGYINVTKDFLDKKPRTRYTLTELGRSDFEKYVAILESIIKSNNKVLDKTID